jgi:hypothetical protein
MPTIKTNGNQATVLRPPATRVVAVSGRDFSYVLTDLKRIFWLGVSLVLAELLLWYLFGHTGLGDSVYSLVSV